MILFELNMLSIFPKHSAELNCRLPQPNAKPALPTQQYAAEHGKQNWPYTERNTENQENSTKYSLKTDTDW